MQNAIRHTDKCISISKKELSELTIERGNLALERYKLKQELAELRMMIFGSKSERFVPVDSKQLQIFEQMIAQKEEELEKHTIVYQREKATKKKEIPVRSAIPSHFPRVEEVIEPDNVDPNAIKIGEEITELLEIKPMSIFVRRIVIPNWYY